ncbi:UDP-glycosyltransferase 75D1 [Platanthera zijinensis]|uniref:Glycosyltransferase n=1 Tax=Platanthera zijinensis TaxID=2320716 RepID=A0AAP0BCV9_9ASPA
MASNRSSSFIENEYSSLPHFLVVTYPAQGHINPCLRLARRLSLLAPAGSHITFSTALTAHRLMFPSSHDQPVHQGPISFIPYSNGFDAGFDSRIHDADHHLHQLRHHGSITLSSIITSSRHRRRPVTCIIYSSFLSWVADLAASLRIPAFLFWIQSATAFAAYWHYFHNFHVGISAAAFDPCSSVTLPLLPPMRAGDLPSFLSITSPDHPDAKLLPHLKDAFLRSPELRVLANTSEELETGAFESVAAEVKIVGVGPLAGEIWEASLFEEDEEWERHIEWLDKQKQSSVVYVSFGSMAVMSEKEVKEIERGLRDTRRPFFWAARKEISTVCELNAGTEDGKAGKVVRWCRQERVLRHKAVGCFVTHCGWNSTLEGLACGVPAVAVPRWTDQPTNAWLMERGWGTGIRAAVAAEGVPVAAEEVTRCVELVMGGGRIGEEIRRKAKEWKEKVREATVEGGPSDQNLRAFVEDHLSELHLTILDDCELQLS